VAGGRSAFPAAELVRLEMNRNGGLAARDDF
jgi:hypothetical protein